VGGPPLRSVSCPRGIEYFRSICPIALRVDALFEAKAQVPYHRKHVPYEYGDGGTPRVAAVETAPFRARYARP